jgi:uncharacterized RDD family membrane protein YckC
MEKYLASHGKRIAAYLLDILPILLIVFAIFYVFFGFDVTLQYYLENKGDLAARIQFLGERNMIRDISILVWVIYGAIMDSSGYQGTFGKYAMKIKVTDYEGSRLNFGRSVKRNLFKIISIIPVSLGFIWAFFDKQHRGWHDMFAKTLVLNYGASPVIPPPIPRSTEL